MGKPRGKKVRGVEEVKEEASQVENFDEIFYSSTAVVSVGLLKLRFS
jgi:hypothetical protein